MSSLPGPYGVYQGMRLDWCPVKLSDIRRAVVEQTALADRAGCLRRGTASVAFYAPVYEMRTGHTIQDLEHVVGLNGPAPGSICLNVKGRCGCCHAEPKVIE